MKISCDLEVWIWISICERLTTLQTRFILRKKSFFLSDLIVVHISRKPWFRWFQIYKLFEKIQSGSEVMSTFVSHVLFLYYHSARPVCMRNSMPVLYIPCLMEYLMALRKHKHWNSIYRMWIPQHVNKTPILDHCLCLHVCTCKKEIQLKPWTLEHRMFYSSYIITIHTCSSRFLP